MTTSAGLVFVFFVFSCALFILNAPLAAPNKEDMAPAVLPVRSETPADMRSSECSASRLGSLILPSVVYYTHRGGSERQRPPVHGASRRRLTT